MNDQVQIQPESNGPSSGRDSMGRFSRDQSLPARGALSGLSGKNLFLAFALLGLILAAYLPALRAGFIWDDDKYVTANPMLTAPDGLRQIWFSAHTQSQYFPLVYTTLRLEHALWGLHPFGYHLVNLCLHGANAILVWLLLSRLKFPGAWFGAALFALHPVNVESVAWVTELKNVESLFFFLLSLLAWVRFDGRGDTRRWSFYFLALTAYALALFAKTTACVLPAVLALIIWVQDRRVLAWSRLFQITPFLVIGVAMGLISVWWEGHLGNYREEYNLNFSIPERLIIASHSLWFYIGKLFWPTNLAFSYPRWNIDPRNLRLYVPVVACAMAGFALWYWRKKIPRTVLASILFYVIALLPLLGFISNFTFLYSFVADHYQYTASVALAALVAGAIAFLAVRYKQHAIYLNAVQCALLLVLVVLTRERCGAYHDAKGIWRDTLAKNPDSWMAHHNLAIELQNEGRISEAIQHYQEAVRLNPKHASAHNNLGLCLAGLGRLAEAIAHFKASIEASPDYLAARNNLALAFARQEDYEQAIAQLRRALELEPRAEGVWLNLGVFLHAQGKLNEAVDCYRKAAGLFPSQVDFRQRLAAFLQEAGRTDEAVAAYHDALQLAPRRADLMIDLGNLFVSRTNYTEAISNYRKAVELQPENPNYRYNLGAVLALQGEEDEARKELTSAIKLKPEFPEAYRQLVLLALRHPQ